MRHKHADKIMLFAKMVDAGHRPDKIVQVWMENGWKDTKHAPGWYLNDEYRVAHGFVEGKPVFAGDQVWSTILRYSVIISDYPEPLVDTDELVWSKPIPQNIFTEQFEKNGVFGTVTEELYQAFLARLKNDI